MHCVECVPIEVRNHVIHLFDQSLSQIAASSSRDPLLIHFNSITIFKGRHMTRSLSVIIIMMCLFGQSFAQSVGLKVGTTFDPSDASFASQRIEAVLSYPLSQKFEVSMTSGYYRRYMVQYIVNYPGDYNGIVQEPPFSRTYPAYTAHDIPIITGIKYLFLQTDVAPYAILEYGRYFDVGNKNERLARSNGNSILADDLSKGTIAKLGVGLHYKIQNNLVIDFSIKDTRESNWAESIELMAGVCMPL
jgi:hypothetical protein